MSYVNPLFHWLCDLTRHIPKSLQQREPHFFRKPLFRGGLLLDFCWPTCTQPPSRSFRRVRTFCTIWWCGERSAINSSSVDKRRAGTGRRTALGGLACWFAKAKAGCATKIGLEDEKLRGDGVVLWRRRKKEHFCVPNRRNALGDHKIR